MQTALGFGVASLSLVESMLDSLFRRMPCAFRAVRGPLFFATWRLWLRAIPNSVSYDMLLPARLLLERLVAHTYLVDTLVDLQRHETKEQLLVSDFLVDHPLYVSSLDGIEKHLAAMSCPAKGKKSARETIERMTVPMLLGLQKEVDLPEGVDIKVFEELKLSTTGLCGEFCFRPVAQVLSAKGPSVDVFIASLWPWLLGLQIADDIADMLWDIRFRRSTFLAIALAQNPSEQATIYKRIDDSQARRALGLRRLAPRTHRFLCLLAEKRLRNVRHCWGSSPIGEAFVYLARQALALASASFGPVLLSKRDHVKGLSIISQMTKGGNSVSVCASRPGTSTSAEDPG